MKKIANFLWIALFICACEKEQIPAGCNVGESAWSTNIKPIVAINCAVSGCHSASRGDGNNFDFTTYDGTKEGIGSFYDRINRPVGDPLAMPPDQLLDPCDLYKLNVWILNGAPEN